MKKYKLIQKYPSLPNTMEIGDEVEWCKEMCMYHHASTLDTFDLDYVEDFPEFWEKIVIKEFKILTQIKDGYLFDEVIEGDGISVCVASVVSEDNILKVKRLSDGEVFTLGDRVHFGENGIIKQFNIILNTLLINIDYDKGLGNGYDNVGINAIKKRKIPLLITEDGEELFGGDSYYRVLGDFTLSRFHINKPFSNSHTGAKFFSTKEKAEEYIKQNKPIFSLKDLSEIMQGTFTKSIKELLKNS